MFDIKKYITENVSTQYNRLVIRDRSKKVLITEAPKKTAPSAIASKLYTVNGRLQTQKYNLNEAKKTLIHLASVDPDFKSLAAKALQDHEKASQSLQMVGKLLQKKLDEFHGPGNEWRWSK